MTMKVGMRELARNSKILDEYDYVEIEDKKTHEYKGILVSPKYAQSIKAFLDKQIASAKQKELDEIMAFAGAIEMDEAYLDMDAKELKEAKRAKYEQ